MVRATRRTLLGLLQAILKSISTPGQTYARTKVTAVIDMPITPLSESKRFIVDCMLAIGTPKKGAEVLAKVLVAADYRGYYSHGMNRLEMYMNDVSQGICDAKAKPVIIKEGFSTAWVDGKHGLGAVVGDFCMKLAMKKAKEVGVGWVCAKGSNHYGISGWYVIKAVKRGLLGMTFSNASPYMTPTRAKKAALGTNPVSLGAPGNGSDCFMLDMATSAVAVGKIEIQKRKNEPIPEGWALGVDGNVTTNAEEAIKAGLMMPIGGTEINAGYKGYGLAMMVEIFCGIMSDSAYGPNVRRWGKDTECPANLGQCFVAINPECFAPGFECRMSDLMDYMRNMESDDPSWPVMSPGDPERLHMQAVDKAGGVRYVKNQHDSCARWSKTLKVEPLKSLE